MNHDRIMLALDLATTTGWCEGPLNGGPDSLKYGSIRLAPQGASDGAVFAGLIKFLAGRMMAFKPAVVAFEAPIDPRIMGMKTSKSMIRRALGLAGVAEGVSCKMGVFNVIEAETGDLKQFWHGKRAIKREVVKPLTMKAMRALGFEPQDEDAADAISIHRYVAATMGVEVKLDTPPPVERLFRPSRKAAAAVDDASLEIPL